MLFRTFLTAALGCIFIFSPAFSDTVKEAYPDYYASADADEQAFLDEFELRNGEQILDRVKLTVPEGYFFLDSKDAQNVLEVAWGNPPDSETLGMIFPKDGAFFLDNWGVEISYDGSGHVSDESAADVDFNDLLDTMRDDTEYENEWRTENGYASIELVGWAEPPHYDAEAHKLYWAKELAFQGDDSNTLNYNIRALGREGVLVLNFIADMDQLAEIRSAAPAVLNMPEFTEGNRYLDFDPSTDQVAAYGIGGLIAGKVLAKTGLLATGLILLKKFWFLLLLPLLWLKNLFNRRSS